MRRTQSNTPLYIFLISMFLMFGLVVFTISNLGFIQDMRKKNMQEKQAVEVDMMEIEPALSNNGLTDNEHDETDMSSYEMQQETDMSSYEMKQASDMSSEEEDTMIYIGPNAPLFTEGTITPTGEFTNNAGTSFVVGTLYFKGNFPSDFAQKQFGIKSAVNITLAFGWRDLPNFAGIEKRNTDNVSLMLPKLSILNIDIEVYESFPKTTMQEIQNSIYAYIAMLFEQQLIPNTMMHLSQQRLSNAYIQKNYSNIEFIPFQQ